MEYYVHHLVSRQSIYFSLTLEACWKASICLCCSLEAKCLHFGSSVQVCEDSRMSEWLQVLVVFKLRHVELGLDNIKIMAPYYAASWMLDFGQPRRSKKEVRHVSACWV